MMRAGPVAWLAFVVPASCCLCLPADGTLICISPSGILICFISAVSEGGKREGADGRDPVDIDARGF